MTTIRHALFIAGGLCAATVTATAQDAPDPTTLTCGEMMALPPDVQTETLQALQMAIMRGEDATAENEAAPAEDGGATHGDAAMQGEAGAMEDGMVQLMAACADNPDVLAMEAMEEVM